MQAAVTTLLDAVLEAVERRGMTHAEIALRVGCHQRSISRLLSGRTCSPVLLDRVARVLKLTVGGGMGNKVQQSASVSEGAPIVGWTEAARVLGVHRNTLLLWRRGHPRRRAWWASANDCRAWARTLVEGG